VTISIRMIDERACTVHERPGWFARWVMGQKDRDYLALRITELGGRQTWISEDNMPLCDMLQAAIVLELSRAKAHELGRRLEQMRRERDTRHEP
jgi:hypothetical protein